MATVHDIYLQLDQLAPFSLAEDYDNCGLLIGSQTQVVTTCVVALDITKEVIDFAVKNNAQLIITHHPIIFKPLQSVTDQNLSYQLIQHNISVISAHTNLDIANGGVNDVLCDLLGFEHISAFQNKDNVGRIGTLPTPITGKEFAKQVKQALNAKCVLLTNGENTVKTVSVVGGAGSDYYTSAVNAKADAFLTGEIKHNYLIDSLNDGIALIVAGHHDTEYPVMCSLKARLGQKFPNIEFLLQDAFLVEVV